MDFEAPMDGWYVFLGVSMASVAIFAVVLSLPSTPVPDAGAAADAIDEVAASGYNASGSYDHDADEYSVTATTIALKNDGGTAEASFTYASPTPVWPDVDTQPGSETVEPGSSDRELRAILEGEAPSEHFRSPAEFAAAVDAAQAEARRSRTSDAVHQWRLADQQLTYRHVKWGDRRATLVGA